MPGTGKQADPIIFGFSAHSYFVFAYGALVFGGPYTYPFERNVPFRLYAELTIPEGNQLEKPGDFYWHAAYEEYGLFAESFYFDPLEKQSPFGFKWPDMDFEHHTYIITYGQELESLSYHVWETIENPVHTGAKVGHAVLKEGFQGNRVYIYEIRKMRIEHDM